MGQQHDIVIAGGGMVGASLACALGRLPLDVAVVEPVPFADDAQPSFDARTLALSRSSQRILSGLGVWARIGDTAVPIRRIHVSEHGRFGTAVIDSAQQNIGELGFVVESRILGRALWDELRQLDRLTVYSPGRLRSACANEHFVTASLDGHSPGGELAARLLVVADGARSELRSALGIGAVDRPYNQSAIVGNVEVSRPGVGDTAFERFTVEGPLALLPAGGRRYVFVLTRRSAAAPAVMELDDDAFLELLQRIAGFRLGRFERIGQRHAYPLAYVRAERVTAARAVIVGNAANGLHPVAGQGYNLSLRDVVALAELIADRLCAGPGTDAGDSEILAEYAAWRRRDQRNVAAFTDGLIRLFDLPVPGAGFCRGLGLMAFDASPAAKRMLARQAMGLGGRLTRLARGLSL